MVGWWQKWPVDFIYDTIQPILVPAANNAKKEGARGARILVAHIPGFVPFADLRAIRAAPIGLPHIGRNAAACFQSASNVTCFSFWNNTIMGRYKVGLVLVLARRDTVIGFSNTRSQSLQGRLTYKPN